MARRAALANPALGRVFAQQFEACLFGGLIEGQKMVKAEWGSKRSCPKCGERFYDLGKEDPCVCIECGNQWTPEPVLKSKQPIPFEEVKKKEEVEGDADLGGGDDIEDLDVDEDDDSPDNDVDLGGDDDLAEIDTGNDEPDDT
jgi:uncharacterized protein (TIGR02300 family)